MKITRIIPILLMLVIAAPAWPQAATYSPEYYAFIQRGDNAFNAGRYDVAIGFYTSAANAHNGNPAAAKRKINLCREKLRQIAADEARRRREEEANDERERQARIEKAGKVQTRGRELFMNSEYEEARLRFDSVVNFYPDVTDYVAEANNFISRCVDEINRIKGYIERVDDIQFASGSTTMGLLTGYGDPIYASDLNDDCYLVLNLLFTPLDEETHKVTLRFRIKNSKGELVHDIADPYGSYSGSWVNRTVNRSGKIKGYIHCDFAPDTYTCEVYINGNMVASKPFIISKRPGEASYLKVNGETEVTVILNPEGDLNTFEIETDAPTYEIIRTTTNIDKRCDISQIGNVVTVKTRPNYTFHPIKTVLTIAAGGRRVKINFIQDAKNVITDGDWLAQLANVMSAGAEHTRTISYKGESIDGKEHYTIMHWDDVDMWYIGLASKRNEERLYGMYITGVPDQQSVFSYTSFYVGRFEKNKMAEGACYDRMGNQIFRGPFKANMPFPATAYPQQSAFYPSDGDMSHRFDYLIEDKGTYLGETYNGEKDGFGIYFYGNGHCWVGTWKDGKSVEGVFIELSGFMTKRNKCEDNF